MNRRAFLQAALATTACGVVAASAFEVVTIVKQDQLQTTRTAIERRLVERYGETQGKFLANRLDEELVAALSQLPNIGSPEENRWAVNMPLAALALAVYRVLVPEFASVEVVGQILYQTLQEQTSGIPTLLMHATYNEQAMIQATKALAARSQQRQYPGDWVMTFVEGDGQDFTYGVDVTECAILKYLTVQGAQQLAPYLCLADYVTSEALGRGLVRNSTLAEGCASCDFRYRCGRATYLRPLREDWPPSFDA
jgi:hypothetical protein